MQSRKKGIKGVRAEKWNADPVTAGGGDKRSPSTKTKRMRGRRDSGGSEIGEPPALASSPETVSSVSLSSDDDSSEPTGKKKGLSIKVLDSTSPNWMERWNRAFRTLEIQQLRSPMFFHVDPGDRDGMLAYTQETGREKDLWEISGCVGKELSKHQKKKKQQKSKQYVYTVQCTLFGYFVCVYWC